MRYYIGVILTIVSGFSRADVAAAAQPLTIQVSCENNPECKFDGTTITLVTKICNSSNRPIEFTAPFFKRTGPHIKLIDSRTGASVNLRLRFEPASLLR